MVELILGGNKSGKSDFGLELLSQTPRRWVMVATGRSRDQAFRAQIQDHRLNRDRKIEIVEVDTELPEVLLDLSVRAGGILVDSLDFWMFSVMHNLDLEPQRQARGADLLEVLEGWRGPRLILVSTEMGLGPLALDGPMRTFVRNLGQLNREIARVSASVYLVVAGLAKKFK